MKKATLTLILILLNSYSQAYQQSHEKLHNWNKYLKTIQFRYHFRNTIEQIKIREGFSPVRYSDHNWPCIGYGQRTAFYPEQIPDTITIKQADLILRKSLMRHVKLCKRVNPTLKGFKLLKMAQNSYYFGIVRAKELNKQI